MPNQSRVNQFLFGDMELSNLLGATQQVSQERSREFEEDDRRIAERRKGLKGRALLDMGQQVTTSKMRGAFQADAQSRDQEDEIVVTRTKKVNRFHKDYDKFKKQAEKPDADFEF